MLSTLRRLLVITPIAISGFRKHGALALFVCIRRLTTDGCTWQCAGGTFETQKIPASMWIQYSPGIMNIIDALVCCVIVNYLQSLPYTLVTSLVLEYWNDCHKWCIMFEMRNVILMVSAALLYWYRGIRLKLFEGSGPGNGGFLGNMNQ